MGSETPVVVAVLDRRVVRQPQGAGRIIEVRLKVVVGQIERGGQDRQQTTAQRCHLVHVPIDQRLETLEFRPTIAEPIAPSMHKERGIEVWRPHLACDVRGVGGAAAVAEITAVISVHLGVDKPLLGHVVQSPGVVVDVGHHGPGNAVIDNEEEPDVFKRGPKLPAQRRDRGRVTLGQPGEIKHRDQIGIGGSCSVGDSHQPKTSSTMRLM